MILETIQTDYHDAVINRPLEWDAGFLLPPSEPGLGIELVDEVIAAHPYATGGRLHLEMVQTPLDSANTRIVTDL